MGDRLEDYLTDNAEFSALRSSFLTRLQSDNLRAGFETRRGEHPDLPYHWIIVGSDQERHLDWPTFRTLAATLESKLLSDPLISARLQTLADLGFAWRFTPSSEYAGGHQLAFQIDCNPDAEDRLHD